MDQLAQRVLNESRMFRKRLSELVKAYDGRWVVFRDGDVKSAFDDEGTAYVAAVQAFGAHGGFVVARVSADACDLVPVSATLIFTKSSP